MEEKRGRLLLVCDLDQTVIANGRDELSPGAVEEFTKFINRPDVELAYMSERNLEAAVEMIKVYQVPLPRVLVADSGAAIYFRGDDGWKEPTEWKDQLKSEWSKTNNINITSLLTDLSGLKDVSQSDQNLFKVSYYVPEGLNMTIMAEEIKRRLAPLGMEVAVIASADKKAHLVYLNILPAAATQARALKYMAKFFFAEKNRVVYAGDSEDDSEAILAGFKAIVVNNADSNFKTKIREEAKKKNLEESVYVAGGGYKNMNGNYTAGILEGLHHFGFLEN